MVTYIDIEYDPNQLDLKFVKKKKLDGGLPIPSEDFKAYQLFLKDLLFWRQYFEKLDNEIWHEQNRKAGKE